MSMIGGIGGSSASQYARPTFTPPKFTDLDTNGDQSLTLDELKSGAPKGVSSSDADKRAEALFSAMDSDGDGSVTSTEKDAFDQQMADRMQNLAFMTQQMAGPSNADIFKQTDSNGDGSVSIDELGADDGADAIGKDGLQKLFDLIDSDGDGSITETESSSFLDAVRSELSSLSGGQGAGGPPPGGPPPGGPPPGGPPPGASADSTSEDEETSGISSLLATAQSAYGSTQQKTLLEQLASIFETAA